MKKEKSLTGKLVTAVGSLALRGTVCGAKFLFDHRREVGTGLLCTGQATASAVKGAGGLLVDLASLRLYPEERLTLLRQQILVQGCRYHQLIDPANRPRTLDSLAVGGDLLREIIKSGQITADVERAYELACPHLALHQTFVEAVTGYDGRELTGFLAVVKGKLFELQYTDYLNNGHLPDGYLAHMATLPNQPGWDLLISGPDGHVAELLQLKAADSVSYVRHALEQYQHIDVITTDEVYSHLILTGAGGDVAKAGMDNADLAHHVTAAADAATLHLDWTPPVISLALIAFTSYRLADADAYAKARHFGTRAGKSYLSYLVGGATAAVTQTWWLGVMAGVGSRLLAGRGRQRRELNQELQRLSAMNDKIINGLR